MDVQKLVILALALLVVVGVIVAVITLSGNGEAVFNKANDSATSALKDMRQDKWESYEGKLIDGANVAGVIDTAWKQRNFGVIISTKSGWLHYYSYYPKNFNYVGSKNAATVRADGQPLLEADIKTATTTDSNRINGAIVQDESNALTTSEGYNHRVIPSAGGYINPDGYFRGSVQYDARNLVQCITFVQE